MLNCRKLFSISEQTRGEKAHLSAHAQTAQEHRAGSSEVEETRLTVHVVEAEEQHSWNSRTCEGEAERKLCL